MFQLWCPNRGGASVPQRRTHGAPRPPPPPSRQTAVSVWANSWLIHRDGPHKEYVVDYIKIATSRKFQKLLVEKYKQPSPLKGMPAPTGLASLPTILAESKEPTLQYFGLRFRHLELFIQVYRPIIDQLFGGDLRIRCSLKTAAQMGSTPNLVFINPVIYFCVINRNYTLM